MWSIAPRRFAWRWCRPDPGPNYLWVPGYWRRNGAEYVWVTGRYVVPPARNRAWVPGEWHHNRRGWYFVEGHWR